MRNVVLKVCGAVPYCRNTVSLLTVVPLPPRNIHKWEHGPQSRALPLPQQLLGVQECPLELCYESGGNKEQSHAQHCEIHPPKEANAE